MKYDEFAFFNQQLANMLRDGLPLEGALKQLSMNMGGGRLKREAGLLEADLSNGIPLKEALERRKLPQLYRQMLQVGMKGGNLPRVLLMLSDYYHKVNDVWIRLKGLMVYPVIVLVMSLGLSVFIVFMLAQVQEVFMEWGAEDILAPGLIVPKLELFLAPFVLGVLLFLVLVAVSIVPVRERLKWIFPAFREAAIAQTASAMSVMLRGGCTLDDAFGVLSMTSADPRLAAELARWKERVRGGHKGFRDIVNGSTLFPPMFVWMVDGSGEDIASGFDRAAQVYYSRSCHKSEMMLYGALPVSILALGTVLLFQVASVTRLGITLMQSISG